MSRDEHRHIPTLKRELAEGKITRRDFLRYSSLLGLSAAAAYKFAGDITGVKFIPTARADMPKGGTLRVSMRCPTIADPHIFQWVYDSNITRQVVEYLTLTGHDNVTRPGLLEGWEASDDLMTWTLRVRPELKWHSGRDFVAEDVAWNLNRVLDPNTGSSVLGLMKGYMMNDAGDGLWDANAIEVVDGKTVQLNIKVPQIAVPEHLFHYPLPMIDPDENGVFGVGSNGNGAFELVEYVQNGKATLVARDDYYGDGPYLDRIEFVDLGDDPSATLSALSSGQVQGSYEGTIAQIDIYRGMPGVSVHEATTAKTGVARGQVDQAPFDDPRVRRAMRVAIDPPRCLELAHANSGAPGEHHHVCPVHPDYAVLPAIQRDPEAAMALLAEAGHPDGIDVEIACKGDPPWELAAVQTMVEQWKEANIRVNINLLPSADFWDVWDKVPFGFTSWTHRPLGFMVLGLAYRSGVPWNESHYANPEFDAVLTQAEGTLDLEARRELIRQLEVIMQEDGPITQPLWRSVYSAWSDKVVNFAHHPTSYIFGNTLGLNA
ncbi:MAG: ABC transporter substrate-binding protein [Gammaproteobacteria bacterium]|nr:ABC transporter substrate-binding protein [Gammaproteobacteria bacterium]